MLRLHRYRSKEKLYEALVSEWLTVIQSDAGESNPCFALAGGTTPSPIYRRLSGKLNEAGARLPRQFDLVATDERWVPNTDAQSNEGLIEACFHLEQMDADWFRLVSLKTDNASPEEAIQAVSDRLGNAFPKPFSAVLLGMGTDGHIASIFPEERSDSKAESTYNCIAATHPASGQARISLAMHRLLNTTRAWLVITGEEKLTLLRNCERDSSQFRSLPVARFLQAAQCDVNVYWSPDHPN